MPRKTANPLLIAARDDYHKAVEDFERWYGRLKRAFGRMEKAKGRCKRLARKITTLEPAA
jgi:hypothetical protein